MRGAAAAVVADALMAVEGVAGRGPGQGLLAEGVLAGQRAAVVARRRGGAAAGWLWLLAALAWMIVVLQ